MLDCIAPVPICSGECNLGVTDQFMQDPLLDQNTNHGPDGLALGDAFAQLPHTVQVEVDGENRDPLLSVSTRRSSAPTGDLKLLRLPPLHLLTN